MGVARRAVCLLFAVTACNSEHIVRVPPVVTAAVTDVWGGAALRLESDAFVGADSVPVVTVGTDTLAVRSDSAGAAVVRTPTDDGLPTFVVHFASGDSSLVEGVHVHGFLAVHAGPAVRGSLTQVPGLGDVIALAYGAGGSIVRVDLARQTATPLAVPGNTNFGCAMASVVPAADDPSVITTRSLPTCSLLALRVSDLSVVDSLHLGLANGSSVTAIHLGTGRWVYSQKNFVIVVPSTGPSWQDSILYGYHFLSAPAPYNIAVPLQAQRTVPVYDVLTAQHRYHLPVTWSSGAAFSPGFDTLFVAGPVGLNGGWLYSLSTQSGARLDSVGVAPWFNSIGSNSAMQADPSGPWLYVSNEASVRVYDRRTLDQVADLRFPLPTRQTFVSSIIISANRVGYLVLNDLDVVAPPLIYSFSLMP